MTSAVPTPEERIAQWRKWMIALADGAEFPLGRDACVARCADELESSLHAHQGEQAKQIAALKQGLEEAAALGAAACTLLTRILDAERVIPRAEAERDARDFLAGRAVRLRGEQ